MKKSAGIAILYHDMILVAHATNAPWYRSYTPPKGGIEEGEQIIDAAIRECKEEIGVDIDKTKLDHFIEVPYVDKSGKTYKTVILFPLRIYSLDEIQLNSLDVPDIQLQREEIDEARFMDEKELSLRVLPRYYEPLKYLIGTY
jgi:8-oxo-dGTP pyrophosphatase MutT (NUDIX family)